jgi:hypothetical protein
MLLNLKPLGVIVRADERTWARGLTERPS